MNIYRKSKKLLQKGEKIKYLSSDELRKKYIEYKDNHIKIFDIMDGLTLDFLSKQNDVIYDSTNLERKYRSGLYSKVKRMNSNTMVINIFIHNGIDTAIRQSLLRKNRDDVNEILIRSMYKTMEIPKLGKDCDIIIVPNMEKDNEEIKLKEYKVYNSVNENDFFRYVEEIDKNLIKKKEILEER